MKDLQERITAAQKQFEGHRVLIVIYDANRHTERRRTNCLRRVGGLFDPILTRVQKPADMHTLSKNGRMLLPPLVYALPSENETLLLSETVYSLATELTEEQLEYIDDFESLLTADGVMVLKFFLHITPEQWTDCGAAPEAVAKEAERVLKATSAAVPWFIVPAEKKWYRDYVIASVVAQSLENALAD
jgi:hypothetical protein